MTRIAAAVLLTLITVQPAVAENWPNWRGPSGNSIAAGEDYPVSWNENKNIAWKVKLPGWGTSTPVLWGDQILVTCANEDNNKNVLVCLNRSGKQLWQIEIGSMQASRNRKASGANPSPVTDGTHVFAYYKSGDLACVDLKGKIVWHKNLQKEYGADNLNWDLGTSPVLTSGLVVVAVMHAGPSYVVAFEKGSGEVAWKTDRDLGAPREARDSYSTPIVVKRGGQEFVVVLGADHVTTYAAADGKEKWRLGGLNPGQRSNFRSIASPAILGDVVFAPYARGDTLTSVTWPAEGEKAKADWTSDGAVDVPTPVAFNGRVYMCGDRGDVLCVDAKTGKTVWTERLPRTRYPFSASPIIAGGKLYSTREDGTTFVLELSNPPKLIATNELRENTYATPAFADGRIYLRTSDYLICVEK